MKKRISKSLVMVLVFAMTILCLSACVKKDKTSEDKTEKTEKTKTEKSKEKSGSGDTGKDLTDDDDKKATPTEIETTPEPTDIEITPFPTEKPTPEVKKDDIISVKLSEAAMVEYETYTEPNGYFTVDIPKGWKVSIGIKPYGIVDIYSYAFDIYDPKNPDRRFYFNFNNGGALKSQAAKDLYINYYGANYEMSKLPIATELSPKGYFEGLSGFYDYTGFEVIDRSVNVLGNDVLVAKAVSTLTGKNIEGIFSCGVIDMPMYMLGIDAGVLVPSTIIMETAPEGEFLDWKPVLDHIFSTIMFSQEFVNLKNQAAQQMMINSQIIMSTANEISGMIMDTWENSNRSYAVISEKNSDATLGYERVYDNDTGNYYLADQGFSDWYDGSRYVPVDSDDAYLSPISGTINWK